MMSDVPLQRLAAAAGLASVLSLGACKKQEQQPPPPPPAPPAMLIVPQSAGMNHPESVLYDSAADMYLVDNINGDLLAKDGNGFISEVSPDGGVVALKWVAGGVNGVTLNGPKGSGIKGDTLFVADIDAVRMFNRSTGAPLGSIAIPGATFLNDLCIGPDGTVYITDSGLKMAGGQQVPSGTDALWKLGPGHRPIAIARGRGLGEPNGIVADSTGVTMVTLGSGQVVHIDAKGTRTELPKPPTGALDGLVRLPDGSLLLTSWQGQAVYRLADGQYTTVADSIQSPADIGWDPIRHRVLIPDLMANRLIFREVK
jgi:sugar lactone lactonase YvrE